jgi:ABC-type iron transport system FetAB ATPase subunit
MFDCPREEEQKLSWKAELPIDEKDWAVGLIVGPSGAGKSLCAKALFGGAVDAPLTWTGDAVIDDFASDLSIDHISKVCSAVGFNTIPAWMRPYGVLSNGEKFRVELARRLIELPDPIVVDEFTSVVDRQVAKIGSHAVQKYVRRRGRRFVAVTCHHDVIDWLQPDWVLEPATMSFRWRSVQPRPKLEVRISRVPYAAWSIFAPYHYLTAELNRAARCFGLWVDGRLAAFCGVLQRPVSHGGTATTNKIRGVSRVVTLPDWQGLGLAFVLTEALGAAYKSVGIRFRNYPAHPAYVRANDRSMRWALVKKPGRYRPRAVGKHKFGGRPCAVFEYVGPGMTDRAAAQALIEGE